MVDVCNVSGSIADLGFDPIPGASIVFHARPDAISRSGNTVVIPDALEIFADADGLFVVDLVPGRYNAYLASSGGGARRVSITVPDAPVAIFAQLINLPPPATLDAAQQAVLDAQAARDSANTSAVSAAAAASDTAAIYQEVQEQLALGNLTGAQGPEGPQGVPGANGADGADGAAGASAYEIAVANGFVGTEVEWLASLQGGGAAPSDVSATFTLADGRTVTVTNGIITAITETAPVVTAPSITASDALVGRTLTITVMEQAGGAATPQLTLLTLDGADVLGDQTGTGPWSYVVPDSAAAQTVAWTVTATNSGGTDTESGSEIVAANVAAPEPYVVAIFGQSQPEYVLGNGSSLTGTIAKASNVPSGVLYTYLQDGASNDVAGPQNPPRRVDVTQATVDAGNVNPALASWAVWFNRVLPGRQVVVVDAAVPGTSRADLWNDARTDRYWTDFEGIVNQARSEFGDVDLLLESWQGNDHVSAKTARLEYFPFVTGQRFGGGAFTVGTANPDAVHLTDPVDHILWDIEEPNPSLPGRGLFARAKTKYMAVGWPQFGSGSTSAELLNFTGAGGYPTTLDYLAAQELDAFMADPRLSDFAVGQHFTSHIADMNGTTHPVTTSADGVVLYGWGFAHAIAKRMGLNISTPTVVSTEGPTDGSYLDVLVSLPNGGDLTTLSALESRAPADNSPHYQPVVGFEIDRTGTRRPVFKLSAGESYPDSHKGTVVVHSASEIHATHGRVGRIRVTPLVPFEFGDTVHFIRGDRSALLLEPRDITSKLWERFPLEHVPAWYFPDDTFPMPGVGVRPGAANLPVSVSAPAFLARGAYFDGAATFSASSDVGVTATNQGLISVWFRNNDTAWNAVSGRRILQLRAGFTEVLGITVLSSGRMSVRLNNNTASDTVATFAAPGSVPFATDQWYHMMISWAGTSLTVWVNGVQTGTMTFETVDMAGQVLTQIGIACASGRTGPWLGDLAHFWASTSQTLDLTVQANREKFAIAGQPVDLGPNGQLVTGTAPEWYYDGIAPNWSNLGTAGNTALLEGTLSASSPPPSY